MSEKVPASMRVLLIEDSSADADLIIQHLRSERHTITFERVDSALGVRAALKNKSWDVVLCDDSMPGFDSRGALSIVKLSGVDVPFIIVSGTMSEQTASDVMRAGARDFLLKDNLTRLLPAIEREMRDTAGRIERKRMQEERLLLDRLVSIGTLAAGVAHEINNPLAYVLANIDFALDKLPGGGERAEPAMDRNEVILALQQAREGSERIRIIARDLKVFCHSDQGDPTSVDVRVVLESAITMAWNEIRHRARLVKVFADVPPVDANENRLAQVFLNLLVNAAQAITEGDAAGNEIRVTTWHELAEVVVEISDTGPGVAPEAQDHLFQPFFTTKPAGMGTGLGLSICQGIIKDLGGTIGVRSETGSGTTVRVSLPKGKLKQTVKSSLPPSSPTKGRRGRILVVDDELSLVQTLQRILEVDHDVRGSSDARAALQMLSSEQNFDVILCDLMMPQMTGMQFHAELVRTSPVMAERVVFLTAGAFTSRAKQFLDSVPNRRLEKPFDARALRATIQKIIARIDIPSR